MYEKSVELNPENENAKSVLLKLNKEIRAGTYNNR